MENLVNSKKNFLIIGSGFKISLENTYIRAFKNLGYKKVDFLFLDKNILLNFLNKLNFSIISQIYYFTCKFITLNHLKKRRYDYIIIFKGLQFDYKFLNKCKNLNLNTKWINIYTDNPFNLKSKSCSNYNILESIKFYDYFCVSFYKTLNKRLHNLKAKKIIFLPFGYDQLLHGKKKLKKEIKNNNINFVGAYDSHREKILNNLNYKINVYGPGWKKSGYNNKNIKYNSKIITGNHLKKIISNDALSLNILREQDKNSHNMRTFEIPAMGGLLLTNRTKEQISFFRENKDCFMYKDTQELKKKIKFIINNKKRADKVRKNGFFKSKKHSYENRLKYLLSIIK